MCVQSFGRSLSTNWAKTDPTEVKLHPTSEDRTERQLGEGFWWIFAASTLACVVAGGSTTLMAGYARDQLGASPGVVGLVIGSSSIVAIALRPALGQLADRHGVRRIAILGSAGIALGSVILILAHSVVPGTLGRIVFGLTAAAANTALIAWVVGLAPVEHRGKALGIFGVSVWIGLALGPQLSQSLSSAAGYSAVWIACGLIGFLTAACVARPSPPVAGSGEASPRGDTARIMRLILRPASPPGSPGWRRAWFSPFSSPTSRAAVSPPPG